MTSTPSWSRREFATLLVGGVAATGLSSRASGEISPEPEADLEWHDVREWGVEGKGWSDTLRYFDRLPGKAEGVVREPVWDLSRHSAGMCARFVTDAPEIHVRYELLNERLAMSHMPASGVSGLDLYGQDAQGLDRWVAVVRPESQKIETSLARDLAPGKRRYTLYLPLYNGVETLEIGVGRGETFEPLAPRAEKPLVFYGTSILHGACASRPGMAFPAMLGRRLRRPVCNLGFSGNGRMEPEVGALLAELDPCVYAIDCLPNMNAETVSERAAPLVRQLRKARPDTPILLVEDRSFTNTAFFPTRREHHRTSRKALWQAVRELRESGVEQLYYLDGDHLLGLDGEAATDGSHPNDLGMMRYADAYEPVLRAILKQY
jgi:lysophospholipase L1-like esterase